MSIPICIIVENMTVPSDRRVWQEANALSEGGYRVSVICPTSPKYPRWRETINGIEIHRYPSFESAGVVGHLVEYSWAILAQFFLALLVYTRTRFRVLQGCNPPDNIFLIALFFKLFGVRYIFDHHDLVPELCLVRFEKRLALRWIMDHLERWAFRAADVTLATNESFREIAQLRGGVPPDRSFVVRTCADLKKMNFTPHPELKGSHRYLVAYVGIMEPQDGLDLLLESIDHLVNRQNRRDTLFTLIGWGTELPRLKAMAQERGLDPWVKFTGPTFGNDLWAYLATADLAVAPDPYNPLNDKLTMIKIMEYMAFGLPVVLYDLREGRRSAEGAALYARKNDPVDFAIQIARLLDSQPLREQMGAEAKARVLGGMNWDTEKAKLLRAYRTALQADSKSGRPAPAQIRTHPQPQHFANHVYGLLRPFLPLRCRLAIRRFVAEKRRISYAAIWPIDETSAAAPDSWPGWPENKRFSVVLTHDVEGRRGLERIAAVTGLETKYGFRSAFNLVPEGDYQVTPSLREGLEAAGFEVGIHGLEHDGRLYASRLEFTQKAARIREYAKDWNASGFRSPLMHHRLDWMHELQMEYDCSTFDTDPFEPEPDGVHTIFPFRVEGPAGAGYIELPYTLPQDHTLFAIFRERDISIWKKKIDWLAAHGGMVLVNTHPDYMAFDGKPALDEYPAALYEELLRYLRDRYAGEFWEATPREVARYYRAHAPAKETALSEH